MRLFVAAELSAGLHDALSETSAMLRGSVRGRFVGPDLFHVTLAFLGNVPSARANDVAACVREACAAHEAFDTSLGALGSFGRSSSAVLWQGFDEGWLAWEALAHDVRDALRNGGLSFDTTGFIPHVTLMRHADLTRGALPMPCVERGTIDTATLFSSDLSGDRPRYEAIERVELGERGPLRW